MKVPPRLVLIAIGVMPGIFGAWPCGAQPHPKLIISEFRYRGPNGALDEFVEVYNASDESHTVSSPGLSTGYGIAVGGVLRCTISDTTVIPARGHWLCANSGYSLGLYAAANGGIAADIPDNAGIALFTTNNAPDFSVLTRLDSVGANTVPAGLYKEGTGLPVLNPLNINYSWHRNLLDGFPRDTNSNAADFVWVDTAATFAGVTPRLGAPAPESLSSPVQTGRGLAVSLVDPGVSVNTSPNLERDPTSDPANLSTFGTVTIRRRITNNTGITLTALRLRVSFIQNPLGIGNADMRLRTSGTVIVPVSGGGAVTVFGTFLEQPPQSAGGGINSSMRVGAVTPSTPFAPGSSLDVQVLLGVQQPGGYFLALNVEALPTGGASRHEVAGTTNVSCLSTLTPTERSFLAAPDSAPVDIAIPAACGMWSVGQVPSFASVVLGNTGTGDGFTVYNVLENGRRKRQGNLIVANAVHTIVQFGRASNDFEFDGRADLGMFRPSTGQWWIKRSLNAFTDHVMFPWGLPGDLPVPADFDGDGHVDPTVLRMQGIGHVVWLGLRSDTNYTASFSLSWGLTTDVAVAGYYDDDMRADPTVYRPSTGQWLIARSTSGYFPLVIQWGAPGDVPAPADFDGDGRTDLAVYRPSTGQWFIRTSAGEFTSFFVVFWGSPGGNDKPAPADYDGDGRADPAVYRPDSGYWFVRRSSTGYLDFFSALWGLPFSADIPLPGDYDGDGRADLAVYRPATLQWWLRLSGSNYTTFTVVQWGAPGDLPARER